MPIHAFGENRSIDVFLAPHGSGCRVVIGGLDLSSLVRAITITAAATEPTTITVDLIVRHGMTVEGLIGRLGLDIVTHEELVQRLTAPELPDEGEGD